MPNSVDSIQNHTELAIVAIILARDQENFNVQTNTRIRITTAFQMQHTSQRTHHDLKLTTARRKPSGITVATVSSFSPIVTGGLASLRYFGLFLLDSKAGRVAMHFSGW